MLASVTDSSTPQPLRLAPHVLLPRMGRDVQTVADRRAAEREEPIAELVPSAATRLGDGERDEMPAPVPARGPGRPAGTPVGGAPWSCRPGARRRGSYERSQYDLIRRATAASRSPVDAGTSGAVRRSVRRPRPPDRARRRGCCRPVGPSRTREPWSEPQRASVARPPSFPTGGSGQAVRPPVLDASVPSWMRENAAVPSSR